MIDTDDLDRTLRAAFTAAGEAEPTPGNPAPRVARRVRGRRRRWVATRVGTVLAVAAIAVATIGGLYSSTREPKPTFSPRLPPIPSVLLTPQTAADRAGIGIFRQVDGAVPSSIRLLATSQGVRLFGAIDRAGLPCVMIVIGEHGGTSAASGCLSRRPRSAQLRADIERYERQGTFSGVNQSGENEIRRSVAGFLLPDDVKTLVIDSRHYSVTRNNVLVAAHVGVVERLIRSGSTLYVVTK